MKDRYNSRLEKNLESQTKKYILLTVLGIVALIIVVVKFGIPIILGTSSFFSSSNKETSGTQSSNQTNYITPPSLNSLPKATKNSTVKISGTASADTILQLYNNNLIIDKVSVGNDGAFTINNVNLQDGTNNLTAKAIKNNKESDFSNQVSIDYHKNAPNLTIDSPSDNATIDKNNNPVTIKGQTDPGVTVTVNGYQATIDENGKYMYILTLQNGGGIDLKLEATDDAGNKTDKQVHITYNQ